MKVRKVYNDVFEGNEPTAENLIFVHYEDLEGYIHYQFCCDPFMTKHKILKIDLFDNYKRIPKQQVNEII